EKFKKIFENSDKIIETVLSPTFQHSRALYTSKSLNHISQQLQNIVSTGISSLHLDSIPNSDEEDS
ncbi:420_t:CDS:1, partial [Cetraspora pellucida]